MSAEERESILSRHTEWLEAKTALEMEASELAHIRSELFKNDKHWKEAAETLAQARKDEAEREIQVKVGALQDIEYTQNTYLKPVFPLLNEEVDPDGR